MAPIGEIDSIYADIKESMERIRFNVDNIDFTTFDENEDDDLLP